MKSIKVLLVEDDEFASELIYNFLIESDFEVQPVFTATDAISYVRNSKFDVILLDINLPDYDGFEVLKSLSQYSSVPVIVISAYSDTKFKLLAFKYGAGDYMCKPLDLEELEARIWLQLKRNSNISIDTDNILFKKEDSIIYFKDTPLELTSIEYDILVYLIKMRNQTVNREEMIEYISSVSSNRSLDNHIKNIRKKIGDNGKRAQYLKTVYGVGYTLTF